MHQDKLDLSLSSMSQDHTGCRPHHQALLQETCFSPSRKIKAQAWVQPSHAAAVPREAGPKPDPVMPQRLPGGWAGALGRCRGLARRPVASGLGSPRHTYSVRSSPDAQSGDLKYTASLLIWPAAVTYLHMLNQQYLHQMSKSRPLILLRFGVCIQVCIQDVDDLIQYTVPPQLLNSAYPQHGTPMHSRKLR